MKKKITTIPATKDKFTAQPINNPKKRRVAGYARVSTDSDEQFTSYEAQVDYYTNYIKSRPDWEFIHVYTDEGITGTNTKHREGFKTMVKDAMDGKIDLIVTKSVSRFARNTVDSLTTVRNLKDKGVEIYFEKENIWTLDSKGELLITIMSSLAQEESRSISENCTWGQRKRFADGKVTVPFKHFLGYDRGDDGNLIVNKEEAKTVKKIYRYCLEGMSAFKIAKKLTEEGIPTPGGKTKWSAQTVKAILTNEKYKGDALLQKSFTVNFLTKEKKINEGEIPQYYVEKNHEAIIEPKVWDYVQELLERGPKYKDHIFSSKIVCGSCGAFYGPKTWHSNSKYEKVIWQCNKKYKHGEPCKAPHLYEEDIQQMFINKMNKFIADKGNILEDLKPLDELFNTDMLNEELNDSIIKMNATKEKIEELIENNARFSQNQETYAKEYEKLVMRFNSERERYDNLAAEVKDKESRKLKYDMFMEKLNKLEPLTEFDNILWNLMVEKMVVHEDGRVEFEFANGL